MNITAGSGHILTFDSYNDISSRLSVKLMEPRRQKGFASLVSEDVGCGFVLVPYLNMIDNDEVATNMMISHSFAENCEVSELKIMFDAKANSESQSRPILCRMTDALWGFDSSPNLLEKGDFKHDGMFLVLTTAGGIFGAKALFYQGIQKKISDIVGGNYYVLPSSIHEVLIIPDEGEYDVGTAMNFLNMVTTINENEVAPEDRLADKIMRYDAKTGRLMVVAEEGFNA